MREVSRVRNVLRRFAALTASFGLLLAACGSDDVTVEQVERQVRLDADGRVVDTSASSTTFVKDGGRPTTTTQAPGAAPLTKDLASDGTVAVDCGDGARKVELTDGDATTETAKGTRIEVALVGTARLGDFDGDGVDDLAAAYRCSDTRGPVALSLSLWRASTKGPTRSAVSIDPIEPDSTIRIPKAPGDRQVSLTVVGPDRQILRQVLAEIDSGRLRLVSDGPPQQSDGADPAADAETPLLSEFPDRLDLTAAGLGPLRLGATEQELTEALALVVSQVQYPSVPSCFEGVDRVQQVGPIYFGLAGGELQAIWVTAPSLVTTDRDVALAAALDAEAGRSITVGETIDASSPPDGLSVLGFGDGWVGLGSTEARSAVSVAAEGDTPGATGRKVTGFGIAERVCLSTDFADDPQ